MQNGICSECGATEVYSKPGGLVADSSPLKTEAYRSRPAFPSWPDVSLTAFICGACGHVALKVEPQDFERLYDVFRGGKWTHVTPKERQQ
jgi:hypothetical protein